MIKILCCKRSRHHDLIKINKLSIIYHTTTSLNGLHPAPENPMDIGHVSEESGGLMHHNPSRDTNEN